MKLILASASPRRIELLRAVGLKPTVIKPEVDETVIRGESGPHLVKRLALLKAQEGLKLLKKRGKAVALGTVILAADTTVISPDGVILGKPRSDREAFRMLKSLEGGMHTVYTGYCLLAAAKPTKPLVQCEMTQVTMRSLSTAEILAYIATGETNDKAGAYAAQGFGMGLIERIRGSYTNVVGLPVAQVLRDLAQF